MEAYDDLSRGSHFLATDQEEFTAGHAVTYKAHDYGASVFVYAHLARFFPAADLPVAHDAMRDCLWERPDDAQKLFPLLSPPARTMIRALMARQIEVVRPQMLAVIQSEARELEALSPRGHIDGLHTPAFVLHGSTDNIIPPAESEWLARDIPASYLPAVLITEAFSHVDPERSAPLGEELRLVEFVGQVLRAANE